MLSALRATDTHVSYAQIRFLKVSLVIWRWINPKLCTNNKVDIGRRAACWNVTASSSVLEHACLREINKLKFVSSIFNGDVICLIIHELLHIRYSRRRRSALFSSLFSLSGSPRIISNWIENHPNPKETIAWWFFSNLCLNSFNVNLGLSVCWKYVRY